MREMKDSGIEWIGEIPHNWNVTMLKHIASIKTGNTPAKYDENIFYSTEIGIPWIKAEDLGTNSSIEKTTEYLTEEGAKAGRVFPPNTVYVCCIASVGKVGYSTISASCNQQINGLCFNNFDWKYGYYLSCSQEMEYILKANGNVIKIINSEKQSSIMCPVPPIKEQQKISTYLDQQCSEIDALYSDISGQISNLEEYKKSVITEAVTKGLNPNVEMKDSGIEWIGFIPQQWNIHPLYCFFKEQKNKNKFCKENNLLSLSYGKIKKKDINTNEGLLPESFNTYNIVEEGDIIIRPTDLQNDKRSLRTGLVKEHGIITSAYIDLCPINNVNSEYYHYLLHSYDVMKVFYNMGNGVRQSLNFDEFSKLLLLEPTESEQKEIVDYLDQKCSEIDALIEEKKEQFATLEEYKKSLIYEYVTGKREVV